MKRKYSWKPDRHDGRDFKYSAVRPVTPGSFPDHVDLRSLCSPVADQGEIGSCTANAWGAGMIEFLELYEKKNKIEGAQVFSSAPFDAVSRLFLYWNERDANGDTSEDSGAELRDGAKALASLGICRESVWDYNQDNLFAKPSDAAFAEGAAHKISQYYRLQNINDMKHCLAQGFPFVLGFMVYEQFESEQMSQDGMLEVPGPEDECVGGHAVCCVGYEYRNGKKLWLIRNSWGKDWALNGYFWMPEEYILNLDLASDFWTARK